MTKFLFKGFKMNPNSNSSKKGVPDTIITKFPCELFYENVNGNDNSILCDLCQIWVHIKCNCLNYIIDICKVLMNHGIAVLIPLCPVHWVI